MPGNGLPLRRWLVACVRPARREARREARLAVWGGGGTRGAEPGQAAGEVMVEHLGHVVCRADGPAPVLGIGDRLEAGRTYLVVPADRLPCGVVTAASLATLSRGKRQAPAGPRNCPFEYANVSNTRLTISNQY
jgi:hypothetical protein